MSVGDRLGTVRSVCDGTVSVKLDDETVSVFPIDDVQRSYTARPRLMRCELEAYYRPWFENRDALEAAINTQISYYPITRLGFVTWWAPMTQSDLDELASLDEARLKRWRAWLESQRRP